MNLTDSNNQSERELHTKSIASMDRLDADQDTLARLRADARAAAPLEEVSLESVVAVSNSFKMTSNAMQPPYPRDKIQTFRTDFEMFVQKCFNISDKGDVWKPNTFAIYCKTYLDEYFERSWQLDLRSVAGRHQCSRTLHELKETASLAHLSATIGVNDDDEDENFWSTWNVEMDTHIKWLLVAADWKPGYQECKELSAFELQQFCQEIHKLHPRVDDWKQHYLAWLLVHVTGVRPGCLTVTEEDEAKDTIDLDSTVQTLRWKDIEFFELDEADGICVCVKFKFDKHARDSVTGEHVTSHKFFTFIPQCKGFEIDVSLELLHLAYSRGLFSKYKSLIELHAGRARSLQKDPIVNNQAVFVFADPNTGRMDPNIPMRHSALNPMLQEMCKKFGMQVPHNMSSLRRETIVLGNTSSRRATRYNVVNKYDNIDSASFRMTFASKSKTAAEAEADTKVFYARIEKHVNDGTHEEQLKKKAKEILQEEDALARYLEGTRLEPESWLGVLDHVVVQCQLK